MSSILDDPYITLQPSDLSESGLLWLINTSVLHPRGLALGTGQDEDGNQTMVLFFTPSENECVFFEETPDSEGWLDGHLTRFNRFVRALRAGDFHRCQPPVLTIGHWWWCPCNRWYLSEAQLNEESGLLVMVMVEHSEGPPDGIDIEMLHTAPIVREEADDDES